MCVIAEHPHPAEHDSPARPLDATAAEELAETLKVTCGCCGTLRLVRARREGRHVRYVLHDHHIADLLAAIRHHHEHVHPAVPVELPGSQEPATS